MDEVSRLQFLTMFCEDMFAELSLAMPSQLVAPYDSYEAWQRTFDIELSPAALSNLVESDLEKLRVTFVRCFQYTSVHNSHLRRAVSRTLLRWSVNGYN